MKPRGYIAIDRGIYDHPLFDGREDWLIAWQRMIASCAYHERTERLRGRSATVKRGQILTTIRGLAELWGWPKSNVHRFLRRLEDEGMIVCALAGTKCGTRFGTKASHQATLITVCNYDKYQKPTQSYPQRVGQVSGQEAGQVSGDLFEVAGETAPNQSNQSNHNNKKKEDSIGGNGRGGGRCAPKHGAYSKSNKTVFWLHGTEEWRMYAADFKETRGAEPIPNRDGGYWFMRNGEATRPPASQQFRRPPAGRKQWKTETTPIAERALPQSPDRPTKNFAGNAS